MATILWRCKVSQPDCSYTRGLFFGVSYPLPAHVPYLPMSPTCPSPLPACPSPLPARPSPLSARLTYLPSHLPYLPTHLPYLPARLPYLPTYPPISPACPPISLLYQSPLPARPSPLHDCPSSLTARVSPLCARVYSQSARPFVRLPCLPYLPARSSVHLLLFRYIFSLSQESTASMITSRLLVKPSVIRRSHREDSVRRCKECQMNILLILELETYSRVSATSLYN